MQRRVERSLALRARFTAYGALVVFVAGNVGWPVTTGSVAGGKCCKVSGLTTCCCGDKPGAKNCGCQHGAAVAQKAPEKKLPSCCQKRLEAAQKAAVVVNCACGESSMPGFVVVTQPKIAVVVVSVADLAPAGDLAAVPAVIFAQAGLAPETPPPRASVS